MAAGPQEVSFTMVDSLKVNPFFQSSYPEAYTNFNGKTYTLTSRNQAEAFFVEHNNQVVLYFRDKSKERENPWVSFTFKNRTVQQLPTTFSAKEAQVVCVEDGQSFADGSSALSPGCDTILNGTVNLQYDPATDVISGSVSNLKFSLEYYVPQFSFPNRYGNVLKTSGSTRNLDLTFKNVKRRKTD